MKNIYLKTMAAALLLLCSTVASAHDFVVNGIYYKIISSSAELASVTFCGDSYDEVAGEYSGDVVIPKMVVNDGETYDVIFINDNAFRDCAELTSITIPSTMLTINADAFNGCTGLTSVHISDLKAWTSISFANEHSNPLKYAKNLYLNGTLLTNVTIPDGVTEIKDYAFAGCSITSLIIPESVTKIGNYVFNGCPIKSLYIAESDNTLSLGYKLYDTRYTSSGEGLFRDCPLEYLYLGRNLEYPCEYAGYSPFRYKSELTQVVIGNRVTKIGWWLLSNCTALTSITIPKNVTIVGDAAFRYCTALKEVNLSENTTYIGAYCFDGCTQLEQITIPAKVETIGAYAFNDCKKFKRVDITDLAAWCKINFATYDANPAYYTKKLHLNGELLTTLIIPHGVTSIGQYAFYYCTGITSVTLPSTLTTIGKYAFYYCTGITSINMPSSITSIGGSAFNSCNALARVDITDLVAWCKINFEEHGSNPLRQAKSLYINGELLTELTIPDEITSIKKCAFIGAKNLTSITIPNHVTSIADYAFNDCTGVKKLHIEDSGSALTVGICSNGNSGTYGQFSDCPLDTVYLGRSLSGGAIFRSCPIRHITIGSKVTTMGTQAFNYCYYINAVHISDLAAWCKIDFTGKEGNPLYYGHNLYLNGKLQKNIVVPDEITEIKKYSFTGSNAKTITLPYGLTKINDYALSDCGSLSSIAIPGNTSSMGTGVFENCTALKHLRIENSNSTLNVAYCSYNSGGAPGKGGFYYCPLETLYLGRNLTYNAGHNYGYSPFYGIKTLTTATVGSNVTAIGNYAFDSCNELKLIYNNSALDIQAGSSEHGYVAYYAKTVITPTDNIQSDYIYKTVDGEHGLIAYTGTDSILYMPDSYNNEEYSIRPYAFYKNNKLKELVVGKQVASIDSFAFASSIGLSRVKIPESVTHIGSSAFTDCYALNSVISQATTAPSLGDSVFNNIPSSATLYYPLGSDYSSWVPYFASTAPYAGVMSSNDISTYNSEGTLSVRLSNSIPCSGLQFDIKLPTGIEFATDEEGYEIVTLSTERTDADKHSLAYERQEDGSLRVLCYSTQNNELSGNDGEILTIGLNITGSAGVYKPYFNNIILIDTNGAEYNAIDVAGSITFMELNLTGDVNNDNDVDVADVTELINMILDESKTTERGDITGDGEVNIADLSLLITRVLRDFHIELLAAAPKRAATLVTTTSTLTTINNESSINLRIKNPYYAFSAMQFDLYLPEGIQIAGEYNNDEVSLGSRAHRSHTSPNFVKQRDGAMRAVIYSINNKDFSGTEGEIASISLESDGVADGSYPFKIKNIVISADGTKEKLANYSGTIVVANGTTSIEDITAEPVLCTDEAVYDLSGRKVIEPVKGSIYIKNGKKFIAQ